MRVLVVHPGPHFSVADVFHGLVKGLKAHGCDVGVLNLDDRVEFYTRAHVKQDDGTFTHAFDEASAIGMAATGIETVCYEWWPDVVVIVSGLYVPDKVWAVLKSRPHHVVYWCTESPYEDDRQAGGGRCADTVILNDPTNLDRFRDEVNDRTFYLPHSYDPDVHYPGAMPAVHDFVFVGTGFPSRIEWLEQVDWAGVDARIGGNWNLVADDSPLRPLLMHAPAYCVDNPDTADMYRAARVGLNLYRKEHSDGGSADGWAMGPREVEMAACGLFFFREPRGEGDALLRMLPTVTDPDQFSKELRWWLDRDNARVEAAAAAAAAVSGRTFTATARRLLELVATA